MEVGIRLLGPTEVGADVALSPRDRVVLSALCVEPGQTVPADVLADALWGESPPKSWGKIVQGSVMRLRRAIGPSAIETTLGGYRLVLPAENLDTVEFERLVARGRSFLALQEPQRSATLFEKALALWRGPPFPEIADWDRARSEGTRLLDVRRAVEEDLVEAHLAAGRAVDAAAEARPLVAREPFRERRWALLATALYRSGRQGEALGVLRRAARTMRDELGLDPGPELVELEARILAQDPTLLDVPNRIGGSSATCPYRGLRPFEPQDADFFFGRSGAIAEAVRRLGEFPLLLVVGPSGSGKSSLARAGIVPAFAGAGHPASAVTPGSDPMAALTTAVAELRARRPRWSSTSWRRCSPVPPARTSPGEFLDRLAALVVADTRVVATLRADYLGWLAQSPEFSRLAERGLLLLTPLTEDELREAIEAPARLVGLVLEPGLVDLLVRDVAEAPGALPLLSHALAETWEHREGTVMTVEGYRSTGGIHSAVARSAEGLFDSLPPRDREVLRSVLQRLVTPTAAGDPVAARVPTRVFAGSPEAPRLLDLLVRSRLVTVSQDTATIAHESLVRAWPRLRTWLDEDVEGQRILAHLQVTADTWDTLGRPDDELYRGARLAAAQEWRTRTHPVLAPVEDDFLTAAIASADAELLRQERDHAHQVRRNRELRGALVAAITLLVVALVAGTMAGLNGRAAQTEARRAAAEASRADGAAVDAVGARLAATALSEREPGALAAPGEAGCGHLRQPHDAGSPAQRPDERAGTGGAGAGTIWADQPVLRPRVHAGWPRAAPSELAVGVGHRGHHDRLQPLRRAGRHVVGLRTLAGESGWVSERADRGRARRGGHPWAPGHPREVERREAVGADPDRRGHRRPNWPTAGGARCQVLDRGGRHRPRRPPSHLSRRAHPRLGARWTGAHLASTHWEVGGPGVRAHPGACP